jgi:hypothetical protein
MIAPGMGHRPPGMGGGPFMGGGVQMPGMPGMMNPMMGGAGMMAPGMMNPSMMNMGMNPMMVRSFLLSSSTLIVCRAKE